MPDKKTITNIFLTGVLPPHIFVLGRPLVQWEKQPVNGFSIFAKANSTFGGYDIETILVHARFLASPSPDILTAGSLKAYQMAYTATQFILARVQGLYDYRL